MFNLPCRLLNLFNTNKNENKKSNPNCACTTFLENHFTNTNLSANEIIGSIWFASSFMMSHNLARHGKDNSSNKEISVNCYPNPSSGYSTISVENAKIKQIDLTDVNGKHSWSKAVDDSEIKIDNSNFSDGVYQLRLVDNKNNIYFLKYIVIK